MIPLMKNTFINEFVTKQALAEFILKASKLSMGEKCREFEIAFAEKQGAKEGIVFNRGGSANLGLMQSLKNMGRIKEGDKVGFSALTWSTNTMPIIQMGFVPVPIDCEPSTLNVMSSNLEDRLKEADLKVFFATNVLGLAGDLGRIRDLCKQEGILFIEDNCEALGTTLDGDQLTGSFGVAATFSFFVAHHMSAVEGGMICTDDEEIAEMLRIVRSNGWDRNLTAVQQVKWRKKYDIKSEFDSKYTFYELGFNFRPTEITGFLGLEQLKYLDDNIKVRETNFNRINEMVVKNDELIVFNLDHIDHKSLFVMPILCNSPELKDKYVKQFSGAGIEIRPMIAGNIQKQPFYQKYVKDMYDLSGTDFIHQNGFYCGNYPELTESDLQVITSCLIQY